MTLFYIFSFFIYGAALGSFASAIIHREPLGQSWISNAGEAARSKCPACQQTLKIRNLIPIFSWILQKGKCADCPAKISAFYPLLEICSALIMVGAYILLQNTINSFIFGVLYPFLISFVVLLGRFGFFSKKLLIITIVLIGVFACFHFYFSR